MEAKYMVPLLLKSLDGATDMTPLEKQAKKELEKWDYFANTDSIACSIFNEWRRVIPELILKDELGPELFTTYRNENMTTPAVEVMILQDSPFFDNVTTPKVETRDDIFRAAFKEAVGNLQKRLGGDITKWQWGKLHTITWAHPLGQGPFAKYLNYGPFPHPGSGDTVRNAWYPPNDYQTTGGPCLRHVVDMADVDASLFVIDGGESGQWKSPHYTDGAAAWYKSQYFPAIMDIEKLRNDNQGLLILRPLPQ